MLVQTWQNISKLEDIHASASWALCIVLHACSPFSLGNQSTEMTSSQFVKSSTWAKEFHLLGNLVKRVAPVVSKASEAFRNSTNWGTF